MNTVPPIRINFYQKERSENKFGLGLVLACLHVLRAVVLGDFLLGHAESELRKVDRVGTHVGDFSGFVELLRDAHGVGDRETQFASGLLL